MPLDLSLYQINHQSPIGDITCIFSKNGLTFLDFSDGIDRKKRILEKNFGKKVSDSIESKADHLNIREALDKYFNGDFSAFQVMPLDFHGTVFQKLVWNYLLTIPAGETRSYQDIARALECPKGSQAIGRANGSNPISIIAPCHRVIGKDGSLTGYAGGLDRKLFLLRHEGALIL